MRVVLLASLIFNFLSFNGQNLVPNPSFEHYINCPTSVGGLGESMGEPYISDWYSMSITPDYLHTCAGSEASNYPTNNAWGSQEPYHGEGYISLVCVSVFVDEREYIAVELLEPLTINEEYSISFYASDADGGELESYDCFSNNIGLKLLKSPNYYWLDISDENALPITNDATINYTELLSDSLGWTEIQGTIIADDAYTHIAIGNFYSDANTDYVQTDEESSCVAMYYIDYVCVSLSQDACEYEDHVYESSDLDVSFFYDDANDEVVIQNISLVESISIYSLDGRLIEQYHQDEQISCRKYSSGIYISKMKLSNGNYLSYKFLKQ